MRILIIGGAGYSNDANSICVRNMTKEFISKGHQVWILSMGDHYVNNAGIIDGALLWQQPMDYYRRLTYRTKTQKKKSLCIWFWIVSAFRHLILLPFYPITSPSRSVKVANKAKKIVEDNKVDLCVCIFNPYDNIYAGMKLKKWFHSIKVVSYHLDLRTASINPCSIVRSYIHSHALASIRIESRVVDKILIPHSGRRDIESIEGIMNNKIVYVGFPVFTNNYCEIPYNTSFSNDSINISYIGSLSLDNRDPSYVLSLLEKVSAIINKKICVHFWGDLGGLESIIEDSPVARYHGMVENQYVPYILKHSDFLLNIGNAIAYSMLPSKVFSLFATGKPIINIISSPQDATIPFFKLYNHSIDIMKYDQRTEDVNNVAHGLLSMLKMDPLENLEYLFKDFTPEYICDEILNV